MGFIGEEAQMDQIYVGPTSLSWIQADNYLD